MQTFFVLVGMKQIDSSDLKARRLLENVLVSHLGDQLPVNRRGLRSLPSVSEPRHDIITSAPQVHHY